MHSLNVVERHEPDLDETRRLLHAALMSVQELMIAHPPSRRLQQVLAMLWSALDSLDELRRADP